MHVCWILCMIHHKEMDCIPLRKYSVYMLWILHTGCCFKMLHAGNLYGELLDMNQYVGLIFLKK